MARGSKPRQFQCLCCHGDFHRGIELFIYGQTRGGGKRKATKARRFSVCDKCARRIDMDLQPIEAAIIVTLNLLAVKPDSRQLVLGVA